MSIVTKYASSVTSLTYFILLKLFVSFKCDSMSFTRDCKVVTNIFENFSCRAVYCIYIERAVFFHEVCGDVFYCIGTTYCIINTQIIDIFIKETFLCVIFFKINTTTTKIQREFSNIFLRFKLAISLPST